MPNIIAIENPWTLPIEVALHVACTINTVSPVAIATRSGIHYAVNYHGASVKRTGYTLKRVNPPAEVPDSPVCWDGWFIFQDASNNELIELIKDMEVELGKAREVYWDRCSSGPNSSFRLITSSHACSGGGWSPKLDFPEASDEPSLMELCLYPNPYRSIQLPDLVIKLGRVEGLMGVTNKAGGLMRCTDHGLLYSPYAALGFDLKNLTERLDACGFIVCEDSFGPLLSMQGIPPIIDTLRCNLEEFGITVPTGREHYELIL